MNPSQRRSIVLAEARLWIRYHGRTASCLCRITFDLRRHATTLIETVEPIETISPHRDSEPFFVEIPFGPKPIECFPVKTNEQFSGNNFRLSVTLVPRCSSILVDQCRPLVRLNAGIVNLGHYWFGSPANLAFQLEAEDWSFQFTPVTEKLMAYSPEIQDEIWFFTHHLSLQRAHGATFSSSEADEQLGLLSTFLSFCHEHWVSPALVSGLDEAGIVAMEQWGTRLLSPWRRSQNWLDEHHGGSMVDVFPGFAKRMQDPEWNDAIRTAVYWYIRADTSHVGPDGAIVLLQAALERLAWHVLVRHRRAISEDGFSRLVAADQLRLLLNAASIPSCFPPGLRELRAEAKAFNWVDGPEAFVRIRNALIHPPKVAKARRQLPYYEGFQLGKWYVELVLLRAFGYNGAYSNRTKSVRCIGEVEAVPWSGSEGLACL